VTGTEVGQGHIVGTDTRDSSFLATMVHVVS